MAFAFIFSDVGVGEWFVLLAVVLIVVGPKKLPATARQLGSWYSRLRRAADGFRRQLMEMDREVERQAAELEREATLTPPAETGSVPGKEGDGVHSQP